MQQILIPLFALSVGLFVFALLYYFIKKNVAPQQNISMRIKALDSSFVEEQEAKKLKRELPTLKKRNRDLKDIPFMERVLLPIKDAIEDRITALAPEAILAWVEHKLILAGKFNKWRPKPFMGVWILSIALFTLLALNHIFSKEDVQLIQKILIVVIGAGMGAVLPVMVLRIMIQRRQEKIMRQLPEVLDLLCVSVQAGLTFDASMRKIVTRMKGPFIDECSRMLDDVRMGAVRRTALKRLSERCDVQEVYLFVTAIIQAERLGTSMARTLSNQADSMRERRRQYVKAQAMKAPVKIVFPLVLFIFPSIFVVALVPTLLSLAKNFAK